MASKTQAHTVPRFYLDGFVAPDFVGNGDPFLWVGSLSTGAISRRSPRKLSIVPGLYDGPGGLKEADDRLETHLAQIENAAAIAIRRFTAIPTTEQPVLPPEIGRFMAWQAARTLGWMKLEEQWINDPDIWHGLLVEPPPPGVERIGEHLRPQCVENPITGERHEAIGVEELKSYGKRGWKVILSRDDHLELLHMQAWYFQVRHFPRLSWTRLDAPDGSLFITSDRGVAWLADGYGDTPPAALRHPSVQLFAPLTSKVALIGWHESGRLNVTPRDVNLRIAFATSEWIAGPTREVVEQSLTDREAAQK